MSRNNLKNHGKPWSETDDKRLVHGWNYGATIPRLAEMFFRSEFAIECRLELLEKRGKLKLIKANKSEFIGTINGKNYDVILNMARTLIHLKIDLMASLSYARS